MCGPPSTPPTSNWVRRRSLPPRCVALRFMRDLEVQCPRNGPGQRSADRSRAVFENSRENRFRRAVHVARPVLFPPIRRAIEVQRVRKRWRAKHLTRQRGLSAAPAPSWIGDRAALRRGTAPVARRRTCAAGSARLAPPHWVSEHVPGGLRKVIGWAIVRHADLAHIGRPPACRPVHDPSKRANTK